MHHSYNVCDISNLCNNDYMSLHKVVMDSNENSEIIVFILHKKNICCGTCLMRGHMVIEKNN